MMMRLKSMKMFMPVDKKYLIGGIVVVFLLDFLGLFSKIFEKDYHTNFNYPYDVNVTLLVDKLEKGLIPDVRPINTYNFDYVISNGKKCTDRNRPRLVYMVKSSIDHFDRRETIRRTWGFENRFSDVKIYTLFILGSTSDKNLMNMVMGESVKYGDIIQLNFIDSYYNNTIKTMSGIKWITEFCPKSRFYFFSDDDMYVSTKNVLRFLRNPTKYPDYLNFPSLESKNHKSVKKKKFGDEIRHVVNYDLPENITLYTGYVFISSPHRHKMGKWYVSLKEYPYNSWPPYVTAGSYILSKNALFKLYYGSFYTKHFKFDDIYLGIVAQKVGIQLFHSDNFYFYKKNYNLFSYKYVIASHGYDNVKELEKVWNEQKEAGNA